MPILNTLEKNDLTNVLCIVTRYFGGIKLGAGGLIRAYSSSASLSLTSASFLSLTKTIKIELTISYQQVTPIMNYMNSYKLYDKKFLEDVYLYYELKEDDFSLISKDIKEITKNKAKIEIIEKLTKFI